ncbi:hypothetical protein BD626DRAFT_480785 [Schizophyllum amplum]|uniref:Uncharacterized protein n=1 Tax=Schizophyllum amplum TaxID=97359 RepID=A0A550CTH8_9AGAR|nr:hypothetical protein BD626DRAFT_480785 [Auriculariopsis ampla]
MVFYKHTAPSTTSLSEDDDDRDDVDVGKQVFFPADRSYVVSPAQWSGRSHKQPPASLTRAPRHHRCPIARLPAELLIYVFKFLHSPRDIYNCLFVSRTWCECSVELLWHKPMFSRIDTLAKMRRVLSATEHTFAYASFIRRLNFFNLAKDMQDGNFCIISRCDRLERLTLVNCEHISSIALERVLPSFPSLVAIDLNGVVNTTNEAIVGLALSSKRLQGINLAGCKHVSDEGVMALAINCPLLRRVKLSGLEQLTDEPVRALTRKCPHLLELDLHHCSLITDIAIRDVWFYCQNMRELRVAYCPELTSAAFPAPLPETNQAAPNPFPSQPPKGGRNDDLPPLVISRTCEQLRMLDMTGCSDVTDDAIDGIIAHAPKIRNLVLSKCSKLTDRSVENICKLGKHLHYLHLGHASKITDSSVRTLARSCTRLRYVDFANCVLLTDMSVFELSSLTKLRRVGLVRVNNLTDEAIFALAERHATLERIHLSYCDQLTVMAIHFLLQKLHKLTHLSLTGVPAFISPDLQQFCRPPPQEFTSVQRDQFCVYSGKGVSNLRSFLTELFDHITEMNYTDDTDYDEETDGEDYGDEHTPAPTPEEEEAQIPVSAYRMTFDMQQLSVARQAGGSTQPITHARGSIDPLQRTSRSSPAASLGNALDGDRSRSTLASGPSSASSSQLRLHPGSSSSRAQLPTRRSIVDDIPIVEPSTSPPLSDVASNRSAATNQSNGAGFFRHYDPAVVSSSRSNGALTPDLNYAELGHGRGIQSTLMMRRGGNELPHSRSSGDIRSLSPSRSPVVEEDEYDDEDEDGPSMSTQTPVPPRRTLPAEAGPSWPHREPASPTEDTASDARGRNVKRSIRNTLNMAEHYASSLLFGGRQQEGSSSGQMRM